MLELLLLQTLLTHSTATLTFEFTDTTTGTVLQTTCTPSYNPFHQSSDRDAGLILVQDQSAVYFHCSRFTKTTVPQPKPIGGSMAQPKFLLLFNQPDETQQMFGCGFPEYNDISLVISGESSGSGPSDPTILNCAAFSPENPSTQINLNY